MTIIVGMETDGEVYIGGDSGAISGEVRKRVYDPKVMRVGEFVIGYSWSFRFGDLLRHVFEPPPVPAGIVLPIEQERYMIRDFVPALQKLIEDGKATSKNATGDIEWGIALIGFRGKLYEYERDGQLMGNGDRYSATGSAYQVALGALHVAMRARPKWSAQAVLASALEAAIYHHGETLGPYLILGTDGSNYEGGHQRITTM